jgi:hypothetical protein
MFEATTWSMDENNAVWGVSEFPNIGWIGRGWEIYSKTALLGSGSLQMKKCEPDVFDCSEL